MSTVQLRSTTGVASGTAALDFLLPEAQDYYRVTVFAVGLAGGETVTAYVLNPNTGVAGPIAITEAGADAVATAAAPSFVLVGGLTYILSKTLTGLAGSVYFSPGRS